MEPSVHLSTSRACVLQGGGTVFLWRHLRNWQGQVSLSVGWLQSHPKAVSQLLRAGTGTALGAGKNRSGLTVAAG